MGWIVLYYMLEAFKWLVIIRAVMSWFVAPYSSNPLARWVRRLTDPVLRPVAEILPNMGGVDISPILVFFVIILVQRVILGLV